MARPLFRPVAGRFGLRLPLSGVFALIVAGAVLVITLCMKGLAG